MNTTAAERLDSESTQPGCSSSIKSKLLWDVPAVSHVFTTRHGGHSEGQFATLNLSAKIGDDRSHVGANRQLVLQKMGSEGRRWVSVKQVHGSGVVQVTSNAGSGIEADGIWTHDKNAALAILVADCVPILMADTRGRVVAAVHAGWRGTCARIAAVMVERLKQVGIEPADLRVALGPAIGPQKFEIGPEVVTELSDAFPGSPAIEVDEAEGRGRADLWELNRHVLEGVGVSPGAIDILRCCTYDSPDYFSHRRDAGQTGRQAGVIAFARS